LRFVFTTKKAPKGMVSSTLGKVGNICGKKQLKEDERRQSAVEFLTCAALRSLRML
jgi:hypothetical protein